MRIISGKNKGRKIVAPANLPVRPTTDMAKESLFNILNNLIDFEGLDVLDLFAGTGNISYEFASRGCNSITSVDSNNNCARFINETAEKLDFKNLKVIRSDAKMFLNNAYGKWDVIFADPPYDMQDTGFIPTITNNRKLLNPNGLLIIEHNEAKDFSKHSGFFDHRKYGKVNFSFFQDIANK
ncbi:MAG: 16S rRNA (guanine(966)-N(2))-methyltransferase RsmD [Bacteroidetes bacterium]|nr:MAG: 16S rRNA (guanine(966)-N(2))-methyltransferase RsmD [Bacteroidota bacterium]